MTDAPTADVAVRRPVALGAPQADFDTMYRLAANLSKAQLLPQALRGKPADLLIIMMYGQELDLSPIQSIQGIYVVNGKPQLAGQLWLAKVRQAGHRVKIEHGDNRCTTTITRGDTGETHTETFTVDDAKRAGLMGKDTYKAWQKRMLMWRSVSDCATVICPEVALGFGVAEVTEDAARQGALMPGQGGGSPLAGVVGAAADANPAAIDAALAHTPAAQPDPAPAVPVVDAVPDGPTQDELADAYGQMDAERAQPAPDDTPADDPADGDEQDSLPWPDDEQPATGKRGGRR
jgi:hypothetical protein